MSSLSKEKILNEVKDDLITFLLQGKINPRNVISPDLNINGLKRLLELHFVIDKMVQNFIKNIEKNFRHVRITTSLISRETRGDFRGKINFHKTVKLRLATNFRDKSLYVIDEVSKKAESEENIVLKEAMRIIYLIIDSDINKFLDYKWKGEWDINVVNNFKKIYEKNIYLKTILNSEKKCTYGILNRVSKSRTKLYRDAANVVSLYRDIFYKRDNHDKIYRLLSDTFIEPDVDTLFELFWCVRIVNAFKNKRFKITKFLRFERQKLFAKGTFEDLEFSLYHQGLDEKHFTLNQKYDEVKIPNEYGYLKRIGIAKHHVETVAVESNLKKEKSKSFSGGTPDIFLVIKKKNKIKKVLIGEVKNSKNNSVLRNGLRELIEYMVLLKKEDRYYLTSKNIFNSKNLNGLLFANSDSKIDYNKSNINIFNPNKSIAVEEILF